MKRAAGVGSSDIANSWSGEEWRFWQEFLGEQMHIGGLPASQELAEKAGIQSGSRGVEFCCGSGGSSRFLVRLREVASVQAVDFSESLVAEARKRTREEGLQDRINYVVADATNSGLPSGKADFVWGEDAWVYVPDKARLVLEAARILRPGGAIAFYDWCEGSNLTEPEAKRCMEYHKFPTLAGLDDYRTFLRKAGFELVTAENTKRLHGGLKLILDQLRTQKNYDALRLLNWNSGIFRTVYDELDFTCDLAGSGKLIQGLFVARKV
jgi:ubiquinone/menaquinone biosynthesis C-methylase UbiE